jgi:hypothetical protein
MTTLLQQKMLTSIARSVFTQVDGDEPSSNDDIGEVWASEIIYNAESKGVFTSLLNANLVGHNGTGSDAVVWLTDDGFKAYKSINR